MAIFNATPPPPGTQPSQEAPAAQEQSAPASEYTGIDIEAWTISALQSLSVSPAARGVGSPLTIPIDEYVRSKPAKTATLAHTDTADGVTRTVNFEEDVTPPRRPPSRPPSRRDSMARREALLKGKEGSRQRRRWENGKEPSRDSSMAAIGTNTDEYIYLLIDRLIGVPNAQPPQPGDWDVQPTHPIHRVPYQIAQFWDRGVRDRVEDKTKRLQLARKKQQLLCGSATGLGVGEVPRDLRETAKRTPAVKDWVRTIEEPVRQFMRDQHVLLTGSTIASEESDDDDADSEEEEIVFAGRTDAMRELQEKKNRWRKAHREKARDQSDSGVVFDSFGDDDSASFKYVSAVVKIRAECANNLTGVG